MEEPQLDNGLLTAHAAVDPVQFIEWATSGQNLVPDLTEDECNTIARRVLDDCKLDKESMQGWLDRMDAGLKLAQLVKEEKTHPFQGAANIKFPLITSAALQFNARAYPAIVPQDSAVKARVWGRDRQGLKAARCARVSEFMSWQLSCSVEEWESETDKLLTILPIVGTVIRKWWHDPVEGRARCRMVEPGKFFVNDKVKCLSEAPRLSEQIPLFPSEIETRIRSGQFVHFDYQAKEDDKQGSQDFIEQHLRYDLDQDGYDEPYIATVHEDTLKLVKLVADFGPDDVRMSMRPEAVETVDEFGMPAPAERQVPDKVVSIKRGSYFAAYRFMPGMDAGFHGTGLGILLGDISEAINGIINMLIDAGHYQTLGGGFIGSELRMKGGAQRFRPGEWKMINASGTDVTSAIVPMTWPGPSATMFQLLGMLIDAGREIASVKDVMTGDAPRQQPATTTLAMIEQGMAVFTAAYKRIFDSLKAEFKILARINAATLSAEEYNQFLDDDQPFDPAADFASADMDIEPVADPRSVTKMQQMQMAQVLMELADKGLIDRQEAMVRLAQAASIPDIEKLMPKPDPMQAQMMQMQAAAAETQLVQAQANIELTMAQIEAAKAKALKDLTDADATNAGLKLDALRMKLEDERDRIGRILQFAGGMARASGNGGPQGSNGQGSGAPQAAAGSLVLGGPGEFGPGAQSPAAFAGMA